MRRLLALIALAFVLVSITIPVSAENIGYNQIPHEAVLKAEEGLSIYKMKVKEDPDRWGYQDTYDISQVSLGESFEIYYIGKMVLDMENKSSLVSAKDDSLFQTYRFIIEYKDQPKSFLTIYKDANDAYQLVGFGGNAKYYALARAVYQSRAGETNKPIMMSLGMQMFLVLVQDDVETILPVPYNDATAAIVASGNGFVDSDQVIDAIRANTRVPGRTETALGVSFVDVWQNNTSRDTVFPFTILIIMIPTTIILVSLIIYANKRKSSKS
jgi:hypothetical protein